MEYILMFISVISLTWLYEHSQYKYSNKIYHFILILLIVILPSILSGIRDVNIGTDTLTYKELFINAKNNKLSDLLYTNTIAQGDNYETGFIIYVWLLSRMISNFNMFEFVNTFLTFGIFFNGAIYFKKKCEYSLTLMVSIYLFVYYCAFLNYGRQGLSISLLWYSLKYINEKNFKKFLLVILFASNIHLSSIIFLPIYFLFIYRYKMKTWKVFLFIFLITILILLGPKLIYQLLLIFSKLGIRTNTILKYARHFNWVTQYEIHISQLLMSVPQLILFSLFYSKISRESEYAKRFYIVCVVHTALTIIGSVDANFNRLSVSIGICELILFASLYKTLRGTKAAFIYKVSMGSYLIVYWCFFSVYNFYHFGKPIYPFLPSLFYN